MSDTPYTAEELTMFEEIRQAFEAMKPGMSGPFDECVMLEEVDDV